MKFQRSVRRHNLLPIILAITLSHLACTPQDIMTEEPDPTSTSTTQPTLTPTSTQTPTNTPSPTLTPTAVNTLTPQDLDEWILNLLSTNGGCQFPCLLGITPGQSMDRTFESLIPVSSMLRIFRGTVVLSYNNHEGFLGGDRIIMGFSAIADEPSDEIDSASELSNVNVYTTRFYVNILELDGETTTSGEFLFNAMQPYALSNILSTYGMPSRVLLQDQIGYRYATSSYNFGLALLYEELGTAIFYIGPIVFPPYGGAVSHCFQLDQIPRVEIVTHDPDDGFSLNEILVRYYVEGDIEEYIKDDYLFDVEEATGVSIAEFYEIFKQPTSRCLFSPYDIWEY